MTSIYTCFVSLFVIAVIRPYRVPHIRPHGKIAVRFQLLLTRMCFMMFADLEHKRSQDFLWGALFFLENVDDLSLVVALETQAKTATLTTPILQISSARKKCPQKFHYFLCLGGALTTLPCKLRPYYALGVHVHPVTLWLCL